MNCLIPCDFAPGLSFPYPSKRLITPHTARPAPIATTSVCKISTAELKKSILHLKQIKVAFAQIKNCWIFINSLPFPFYPFYPFSKFNCAAGIFPYGSALISWWLCFLFLSSLHLSKKFAISTPSYFAPSCRKVLFNKKEQYIYTCSEISVSTCFPSTSNNSNSSFFRISNWCFK